MKKRGSINDDPALFVLIKRYKISAVRRPAGQFVFNQGNDAAE